MKHQVTEREVSQCFCNKSGGLLEDDREDHLTTPRTEWFISETNRGRLLKVCFVWMGNNVDIKTAYEPSEEEQRIYDSMAY